MATTADETDQFDFGMIQLTTDQEKRDTHRLDESPYQIQRPDVVDDLCNGLLLQARIDRIIHGHESDGGSPATLIVFGFRFHGIDDERRFRQAVITILFRDEKKRNSYDPEVVALWPNGDFILGEPTEVEVEKKNATEVGADLTGGTVVQGGGHVVQKWEHTQSFKKSDKSTLTGSIVLDTEVRYTGANNAVRLTISENRTAGSGVVTEFRAAVLLKRKNNSDTFMSTVKMKGKVDFLYSFVRGLRNATGLAAPNGAVRFKPGVQYLRPPTSGGLMEAKLAEEIDMNKLTAANLDGLAGVLGTTVLAT